MPKRKQPTQKTQPRGKDKTTGEPFEPVDIPVPKRKQVEDLMQDVIRKRPAGGEK